MRASKLKPKLESGFLSSRDKNSPIGDLDRLLFPIPTNKNAIYQSPPLASPVDDNELVFFWVVDEEMFPG